MNVVYGRKAAVLVSTLAVAAATLTACEIATQPVTASYPYNVSFQTFEGGEVTLASDEDGSMVFNRTEAAGATESVEEIPAAVETEVTEDGSEPATRVTEGTLSTVTKKRVHPSSRRTLVRPDGSIETILEPGWTHTTRLRKFADVGPEVELGTVGTGYRTSDGAVVTQETQTDGAVLTTEEMPTRLVTRPTPSTGRRHSILHVGGVHREITAPALGSFEEPDGTTVTRTRLPSGNGIEVTWDYPDLTLGKRPGADAKTLVKHTIKPETRKATVPLRVREDKSDEGDDDEGDDDDEGGGDEPGEPEEKKKKFIVAVPGHGEVTLEKLDKPTKIEVDLGYETKKPIEATVTASADGHISFVIEPGEFELQEIDEDHVAITTLPAQISGALESYFGTPQAPFVLGQSEEFPTALLQQGREMYRVNCIHCHGTFGAADGPTAEFFNPKPRDFRRGIFKFKSTPVGKKPLRADIERVIRRGAHGTMMPSFDEPWDVDISALAAYVQLLAMRGEVELLLLRTWIEDAELDPDTISEQANYVLETWEEAEAVEIAEPPEGYDLSSTGSEGERPPSWGRADRAWKTLFANAATANCMACHGIYGAGDGPDADRYKDAWGNPLRPANLQRGELRGGKRPVDIYMRIAAGIDGTPMPGYAGTLTDEQIWDLVAFVKNLSHPEYVEEVEKLSAPGVGDGGGDHGDDKPEKDDDGH